MDRNARTHRGRNRKPKKKLIDELDKAEESKEYFSAWICRSKCQPCDRAEAGFQLHKINQKITALNAALSVYGHIQE